MLNIKNKVKLKASRKKADFINCRRFDPTTPPLLDYGGFSVQLVVIQRRYRG